MEEEQKREKQWQDSHTCVNEAGPLQSELFQYDTAAYDAWAPLTKKSLSFFAYYTFLDIYVTSKLWWEIETYHVSEICNVERR